METETPSVTSLAAATRTAGVIRLRVPSWSSSPQRPAFDSWVAQASIVAPVIGTSTSSPTTA